MTISITPVESTTSQRTARALTVPEAEVWDISPGTFRAEGGGVVRTLSARVRTSERPRAHVSRQAEERPDTFETHRESGRGTLLGIALGVALVAGSAFGGVFSGAGAPAGEVSTHYAVTGEVAPAR